MTDTLSLQDIKDNFTAHYSTVERLARFHHRHAPAAIREDCVANTIGESWKGFLKMTQAGELDPVVMLPNIVRYASLHTKEGKLIGGYPHVNDVMNRSNKDYHITHLPHGPEDNVAAEVVNALQHRVPGPAEEAQTNTDWQAFVATLTPKERSLTSGLQAGQNLTEIAEEKGISKAAAADMRARIARKWDAYSGVSQRG